MKSILPSGGVADLVVGEPALGESVDMRLAKSLIFLPGYQPFRSTGAGSAAVSADLPAVAVSSEETSAGDAGADSAAAATPALPGLLVLRRWRMRERERSGNVARGLGRSARRPDHSCFWNTP